MRILYLLSVWLHILTAAVWLGGMLFLVLVLLPVVRRPEYQKSAGMLFHAAGLRFRGVGWIGFGLLILTGVVNLAYRQITWATLTTAAFWQGPFGRTLGWKLLLVAITLLASAYHDFYAGPRATAAWQADPTSSEAQRLRKQASWFGRLNLLLGLAIVLLAVALTRGGLF
jgi:uncharacterized membrane protein